MGAVAGIRQAVVNNDFPAGDKLNGGFFFTTNLIPGTETPFGAEIRDLGFEQATNIMPLPLFRASNYTLIGKQDGERFLRFKNYFEELFDTLQKAIPSLKVNYTPGVKTEEDLFEIVRGVNYEKPKKSNRFMFAIKVPEVEEGNDFTIYMSANFPPFIPNTLEPLTTNQPSFDNFNLTAGNGFLTLQYLIANVLTETPLLPQSNFEVFLAPGSTKAFTQDLFMEQVGGLLALFLLLIFIAPQYRLVAFLTGEKATKAREGMKIMGLTDLPYWISWFIYYVSVCITISIICSVIFVIALFPNSSVIVLFLFVFLYGMSIFSFCLLVSSLLQRPRVAGILATLLHFLTYFGSVPIRDPSVGYGVKVIFSFVPNIGMSLALQVMSKLEAAGQGATFSTIFTRFDNYEFGIAFITWAVMFVVMGLLALYLDNVLPKEFGKRQPVCFMFTREYWFGENRQQRNANHEKLLNEDDNELNGGNKNFEAVPQNIREQENNGSCMKVRNLRKVYPNGKEAVRDLSLTMYQNQIFALLGHNGAGKTTTLSILTGLYQPTSGEASVFNLDMFGQVNELRTMLGV